MYPTGFIHIKQEGVKLMTNGRILFLTAMTACTLLGSLAAYAPVFAQDGQPQVRGRMIIRGPDGEHVIDLDPSQLPALGQGGNLTIMRGPDGQIMTFSGSPE